MFENLRRRLTVIYALIFGVLILAVVAVSYALVWYAILNHERQQLVEQIYHEGEEYVNSGEPPVTDKNMEDGEMLAYFVRADGITVLMDQLNQSEAGRVLMLKKALWPRRDEDTKMLRIHSDEGIRYRYLAAVAPVYAGDKFIGRLYMFKSMEFYYQAAYKTLFWLLAVSAVIFAGAIVFSYWLAGRNIRPIQQMYEKQKQFTADASHEMRTPLAVLSLAAEGLQMDGDSRYSAFAVDTLGIIRSEVRHMQRLTNQLMELARRESDDLQLTKETLDITALCTDTAKHLQFLADLHGSSIKTKLPPALAIKADGSAVKMLLTILLENAVKYSGSNSVIELSALNKGKNILLEIKDNGPGISDADKSRIFERFYRVDKSHSRSTGGFGLGLALAHAIVDKHRGKIWLEDNLPHGCIVKVLLPK